VPEDQVPPPPSAESSASTLLLPPSADSGPARPPVKPKVSLRKDKPLATWPEVGLVIAIGFLGNIALRTTVGGLGASLAFALAALLVVRRTIQRTAFIPLGLAALLIPWLAIRSNPALTFVTFLAVAALLMIAGGFSISGSFFDSRARVIASHVSSSVFEWLMGTAMVQRLVRAAAAEQKALPLLRGVVVAIPVLIVFTTLLASADDVFAKLLQLDNLPSLVGHLVLTGIVVVPTLGILSRAAHVLDKDDQSSIDLRMIGPVEVTTVLGSLAVLFGAFVATQIVVAAGGADHVLETEGLTQVDHARRGFFQLLWVAGLAVSLVGGLRATRVIDPNKGRDRFVPLSLITLALTLTIAAFSVQRLLLYVDSFGLTTLRIWALAGAVAIGVAILLFALSIAGWRREQSWFTGAMVVLVGVLVLGLNVVNPDAIVASHNIDNQSELDVNNIARLSDDAIPTIIDRLDDAPALEKRICARANRFTDYGPLDYNWAEVRADAKLDALCGQRTASSAFWDDFVD